MKPVAITILANIPIILLSVLCGCVGVNQSDNEMPMYNGTRSPLLAEASQGEQSQYRAKSRELSQLGWEYFYKDDRRTAIKRFNQAWLLDPENPGAWWGFGAIMGIRGEENNSPGYCRDGIKYLEKALELSNEDPKIKVDLAIAHTKCGQLCILVDGNDVNARKEFNVANEMFEQVKKAVPDFPPLWLNWAYLKYYEKDYAVSGQYLDKARHLGVEVPKKFVQALAREL